MVMHDDGCALSPGGKLRKLLARDQILVVPGVYDGFSTRIALDVGFDCLYMTGAGTCASKLGQPDLGLATLNDMKEHAEMIANIDPQIPLIADADTGYGGPNMVARTVGAYHRAGVAALHIEDQVLAKRCGHLDGKKVVGVEEFTQRILAAVQARETLNSEIVIIARTDALQTHSFDEAIKRLKAAITVGADVAFLEGLTSVEQAKRTCELLAPTPVLLNMVEHGATPSITPLEAQDLGFKVIIFPFAGIAPAYYAMRDTYAKIKKTGKTGLVQAFTPQKLFNIVGLDRAIAVDQAAGGCDYLKLA